MLYYKLCNVVWKWNHIQLYYRITIETGGKYYGICIGKRKDNEKAEQIQNLREEQQRVEQIQREKNALQGMM